MKAPAPKSKHPPARFVVFTRLLRPLLHHGSGAPSPKRRAFPLFLAALTLALLLVAQPAAAKEADFDFCPSGSLGGQCSIPRGIAINEAGAGGVPAGTLYLSDNNNRRVQSFTAAGAFIRTWGHDVETGGGTGFEICEVAANCKAGVQGGAAGQFNSIGGGIAVNQSTGNVYIVDRNNLRVQEFSATGAFIRTWGADVDSTGGSGFEICEVAANCKAGIEGTAGGMFAGFNGVLAGIATDSAGNVYVADSGNRRIQKFDSEGHFLRAGGTDVDVGGGTGYEVCTVAANCKAGVSGAPFASPEFLAASPAGSLYAVDRSNHRVYRFDSALALDSGFNPPIASGAGEPLAIAVNPANGDLFLANRGEPTIYEIDPVTGEVIEETFESSENMFGGLAVNGATGELYASPSALFASNNYLRAFDLGDLPGAVTSPEASAITGTLATLHGYVNPVATALTECAFQYTTLADFEAEVFSGAEEAPCAESPTGTEPVAVHADLTELQLGTPYRFRLIAANANGQRAGKVGSFQTVGPRIADTWSEDVTYTEARLKAEVDPEGKPTTFRFDYGTTTAYGSQTPELAAGSDSAVHEVGALVSGLAPGTTYHYRAIASSVDGVRVGPDRSFATYRVPVSDTSCTNQALRTGPAVALPDCRGYEMVSPVDKAGGDIAATAGSNFSREAAYRQASLDGDSVTYTSSTSFGDARRSTTANQYLSARGPEGWSTHGLNPPQGTTVLDQTNFTSGYDLGEVFLAFTPDLCGALMRDHNLVPLEDDAITGFTNLYERDNCGPGVDSYRAITAGPAPVFSFKPEDLGMNYATYSADGSHIIFGADAVLDSTPPAAENTNQQLYDYELATGTLRLVSVLPVGQGGGASTQSSALGAAYGGVGHGRESPLAQAVSADGSRLFWTAGEKIYVRVDGTTTVKIADSGLFLGAASDGSAAIYIEGGQLREFDVDKALAEEVGETSTIAGEAGGLVGASEDLSRLYFTSKEALASGAVASELNLYLREGGTVRLVATLAKEDGAGAVKGAQVDSSSPFYHTSHTSVDGRYLAFMSIRPLTGYDNVDAQTRKAASEVFRYDAVTEDLACVSCRASGARPEGRVLDPVYAETGTPPKVQTAAWLPSSEWGNFTKRALSADGNRILFNSYDALLPRDTNGAQDVYQWEAPGTGTCTESSSSYMPSNEGCIDLLSTGQSPQDSELLDASASGNDVFFTTASSIDPRDPGSIDVYDARVGGGTAPLPAPPASCEGEACQSPPAAPDDPTPASSSFEGAGNVTEPPAKPRCKHGKVRRHGRCAAKKHHKRAHGRHADKNRRAAR